MMKRNAERHNLLTEFEHILEEDAMINEIGFVHPSQFGKLNNEVVGSHPSSSSTAVGIHEPSVHHNKAFWHGCHKLGISKDSLLSLYKEAKLAFMTSLGVYKLHETSQISLYSLDNLEKPVLMHSKALLLISSDFGTAWNSRKLVLSNKQALNMFTDELSLTTLVLSRSPKSDPAWCHRRWAIKIIAERCSCFSGLIEQESKLVEQIAEKSKMNYRAWNHTSLLVASMTREQALHELRKSKSWAALHVADNCCFHYRRRLLLKIWSNNINMDSSSPNDDAYQIWKEELDWDGMLIMKFIGREALWLHRRFLSTVFFSWGKETDMEFVGTELRLVNDCSVIPDYSFGDFVEQAMFAASYALWLTKKMYQCGIDIREKMKPFRSILVKVFPERASLYNSVLEN